MNAIPEAVRRAAVEAVHRGVSVDAAAARAGVSRATVARWLRWEGQGRSLAERKRGGPRPPVLSPEDMDWIEARVTERPYISRAELRAQLLEERGKRVGLTGLQRALKRRGIRADRPLLLNPEEPAARPRLPTRYQAEHRRKRVGDRYPSSLTDDEWAVVAPLFARTGAGRKPVHSVRHMLDAIFYVARTGCSWRMLPSSFPQWEGVYARFRRWSQEGVLEQVHDRLRELWRQRQRRDPDPSGGIVDSQSVKTTEKGGPAVLTEARRSSDESGISS